MRALALFLRTEAAGGVALLAATIAALVWINVAPDSYADTWDPLRDFINEGLMALFFFVVGLEIKRELVTGELRDRRVAALPAIAAVGGMVVPIAIYLAVTAGTDGMKGWGIPMATDIAFAVGVLALVAPGVPAGLKLFLLTLAIVDDIGAIVVIALFYGHGLTGVYPLLGTAVALCVPARAKADGVPLTERLERVFHPIVSFGVIPLFALANAGIEFGHGALSDGLTSRITYGVVLGLCVGKLMGIGGATALAVRVGAGRNPEGSTRSERAGVAALGGIGFTVALFVSDLAFGGRGGALSDAKLGVFVASLASAAIGAVIFKAGKAPGPSRQP